MDPRLALAGALAAYWIPVFLDLFWQQCTTYIDFSKDISLLF